MPSRSPAQSSVSTSITWLGHQPESDRCKAGGSEEPSAFLLPTPRPAAALPARALLDGELVLPPKAPPLLLVLVLALLPRATSATCRCTTQPPTSSAACSAVSSSSSDPLSSSEEDPASESPSCQQLHTKNGEASHSCAAPSHPQIPLPDQARGSAAPLAQPAPRQLGHPHWRVALQLAQLAVEEAAGCLETH
jgi:hypothetical protein